MNKLRSLIKADPSILDELAELIYEFGTGDCYRVACSKYCDVNDCKGCIRMGILDVIQKGVPDDKF